MFIIYIDGEKIKKYGHVMMIKIAKNWFLYKMVIKLFNNLIIIDRGEISK